MATEILVDADACPVKAEIERVATRHEMTVYLVSNSGIRPSGNPLVRNVVVSDKFDAADDWIAERAGPNTIVVTADIQLADRCIKSGALVLGPTGKPFTENSIGTALAMRELSSQLRDMGEIKGGGPAFSAADRSRFLNALEALVQKAKRG
ncbi:YaiI/YqxD family protein [Dongia sp.]|uniref:YaiI/YqxD family protein n=1 Tax=Dongia sp. TaxID=1977262 RepID=UPI0035B2340D